MSKSSKPQFFRSRQPYRAKIVTAALAAAYTSCLGAGQAVHADISVVTQVSVTGLPGGADTTSPAHAPLPNFTETIKTFFQGDRIRAEITGGPSGGTVWLYDDKANNVFEINPREKTFRVGSLKSLESSSGQVPERMAGRIKIDTSLKLEKTADTRTYLNTQTIKLAVSGETKISRGRGGFGGYSRGRHRPGGGFPGGGFPGGGFPGGGFPGGGLPLAEGAFSDDDSSPDGQAPRRMNLPASRISGEVWEAEAFKFPPKQKIKLFPLAVQMAWGGGPFCRSLAEQLEKRHEFPLHSEIMVTRAHPRRRNEQQPETSATDTITTVTDVTSLSYQNCDSSLFQVPQGYLQEVGPIEIPQ